MKKNAFTLIELLLVIAMIGILIAMGIVAYGKTQKRARDNRRKSDLESIRSALEMYRADNNTYPSDWDDLDPDYIAALPKDPKDATYTYSYDRTSTTTYCLCAFLESGAGASPCSCTADCTVACNYSVQNP